MTKEKSKNGKGILYVLLGGGIGAVLALLFAPKTGKQLRGEIGDAAQKGLDKTEEFAAQAGEKAQAAYADTKIKAGELYDAAKQKIDSAAASITDATGNLQDAFANKSNHLSADIESDKKADGSEYKGMTPLSKEAKAG